VSPSAAGDRLLALQSRLSISGNRFRLIWAFGLIAGVTAATASGHWS
jgi:hypothetical protein